MSYLIDTYGAPTDAELQMSGCVGASRYISHTNGKNVTIEEVAHIHSLNKLVQLNFEDSATNAQGGSSQGSADASFVLGQLRALPTPKGVAVYFSVDFEVHTGQPEMAVVVAYFRPIQAALHEAGYKVGAYGNADVIAALFAAGVIDFGWQTVAWSYGKRDPHAVELQDTFTQSYDKDEILAPYIGAWTPSGAQAPPTPQEVPTAQTAAVIPTVRKSKMFIVQDLASKQAYLQKDDASLIPIYDVAVVNAYKAAGVPVVPLPPKFVARLAGAVTASA